MNQSGNLYRTYSTLTKLEAAHPDLAKELLDTFNEGEWQNNQLILFDNVTDYAKYEVIDGWYVNADLDRDWNGAPRIIDFIDYESLGKELEQSWDTMSVYKFSNGQIISSCYGW